MIIIMIIIIIILVVNSFTILLVIGWIHLCRMFSLNYLCIANIFHDFFRNSVICFSIDLEQIVFFEKVSFDLLSLCNVNISPLSTKFVVFNSAGLA